MKGWITVLVVAVAMCFALQWGTIRLVNRNTKLIEANTASLVRLQLAMDQVEKLAGIQQRTLHAVVSTLDVVTDKQPELKNSCLRCHGEGLNEIEGHGSEHYESSN